MKKYRIVLFGIIAFGVLGFARLHFNEDYDLKKLRKAYSSGAINWPKPLLHEKVDASTFKDIGVLDKPSYPENNPYNSAKAELGKMLFFDPRLSSSKQIACASCHNPELGWTDNITRSFGHDRQTGQRNAMTLLNIGHATSLFWDGRANSLEMQAGMPVQDKVEMNETHEMAVEKIAQLKDYQSYFKKAFGSNEVTIDKIKMAIATFERGITSSTSKFDRFISGDSLVFSDEEVLGLHLFRTKAGCINCHNTPYFSDNAFHNDGQMLFGTKNEDLGRYNVTNNPEDLGKFRTPTLREVVRTGPWMHHGHFPSLLDVVEFYNLGNPSPVQEKYKEQGRYHLMGKTSPMLKKLELSKKEVNALIAFLNTLTTKTQRIKPPELPKK